MYEENSEDKRCFPMNSGNTELKQEEMCKIKVCTCI